MIGRHVRRALKSRPVELTEREQRHRSGPLDAIKIVGVFALLTVLDWIDRVRGRR